jgi:hypothetical protein
MTQPDSDPSLPVRVSPAQPVRIERLEAAAAKV